MNLTADTITDEQIETLKASAYRDGLLVDRRLFATCAVAVAEHGAVGHAARARCAEIFNSRNAVKP